MAEQLGDLNHRCSRGGESGRSCMAKVVEMDSKQGRPFERRVEIAPQEILPPYRLTVLSGEHELAFTDRQPLFFHARSMHSQRVGRKLRNLKTDGVSPMTISRLLNHAQAI